MIFNSAMVRLLAGKDFSRTGAARIFKNIFSSAPSDPSSRLAIRATLLLIAARGERADEVLGCLDALRSVEKKLPSGGRVVDTCGTGGDRKGSVNISTLSALLAAAAGAKVAKHGNRSVSSRCGSSDLMEALGFCLDTPVPNLLRMLRETGFAYFHAPAHHPAFKNLEPIRRSLRTRTIFNLLGPLCNPMNVDFQLLGVSNERDFRLFSEILKHLPRNGIVCLNQDGFDELTSSCKSRLLIKRGSKIRRLDFDPRAYGFARARAEAFAGGKPAANAAISLKILSGKLHGPVRDTIILNAAFVLWGSKKAESIEQGIQKARQALDSGAALAVLRRSCEISQKGLR